MKPIPYSSWIKSNTQENKSEVKPYRNNLFPLIEKENLTEAINLQRHLNSNQKYTIKKIFNLQDTLDNIHLSKTKFEKFCSQTQKKLHLKNFKKLNLDFCIRQFKSWHKYKTKPIKALKADITNLEN